MHLAEAWERYAEVQARCREFFGDFLMFFGGLAFRSIRVAGLEDRIYRQAEALVTECAEEVTGGLRPAILPAVLETMVRSEARVIGLRLPEWTIWSLPLVIHELGHVLPKRINALKEFVDNKLVGIPDEWDKWRKESYLYEIMADVFATRLMGPAYPCALLMLGLDPLDAYTETIIRPAAAARAYVVLRSMELMDDPEAVPPLPYGDIMKILRSHWDELLKRVGGTGQVDAAYLDNLVSDLFSLLSTMAILPLLYTCAEVDRGLKAAQRWAWRWNDEWKKGLQVPPDLTATNWVRDALNAAWLCRIDHPNPDDDEKIAEATYQLMEKLLERKQQASEKGRGRVRKEEGDRIKRAMQGRPHSGGTG